MPFFGHGALQQVANRPHPSDAMSRRDDQKQPDTFTLEPGIVPLPRLPDPHEAELPPQKAMDSSEHSSDSSPSNSPTSLHLHASVIQQPLSPQPKPQPTLLPMLPPPSNLPVLEVRVRRANTSPTPISSDAAIIAMVRQTTDDEEKRQRNIREANNTHSSTCEDQRVPIYCEDQPLPRVCEVKLYASTCEKPLPNVYEPKHLHVVYGAGGVQQEKIVSAAGGVVGAADPSCSKGLKHPVLGSKVKDAWGGKVPTVAPVVRGCMSAVCLVLMMAAVSLFICQVARTYNKPYGFLTTISPGQQPNGLQTAAPGSSSGLGETVGGGGGAVASVRGFLLRHSCHPEDPHTQRVYVTRIFAQLPGMQRLKVIKVYEIPSRSTGAREPEPTLHERLLRWARGRT